MDEKYVTIDVVKTLLQSQADAYRSSLSLLIQDVKEEMKSIRQDVNDLKVSLQFSQGKLDEAEKKLDSIDLTVSTHKDNLNCMNEFADFTENQLEYLENQNRRCNIRIIGLSENQQVEKTWDDTEQLVKKAIKEKLNLADDFEIERCHRVKHKSENNARYGQPIGPRPIVAKMARWKDKEKIIKKAREVKLQGIRFVPDLSNRTLQKRKEQVPELLAAREAGKIAYFILDKLVIKEKPPPERFKPADNGNDKDIDQEVSFKS